MSSAHYSNPLVSVIIVSYNCKELLVEAIDSIHQFVKEDHEIIVVDNASSDDTQSFITASFPEVQFIANTKNVGFSKANNQGFAISKGAFILLLNPDAKLIDTNLTDAIQFLQASPQNIIGPKLLNPDLSLQDSVIQIPTFRDVFIEAVFLSYFFMENIQSVLKRNNYALSGACLLISRNNYALLEGLDEDLFWMDDVDFCLRAKKLGLNIVYFQDWSVVHVIGQSGKKNYKVSISNQLISKLKFFKKHGRNLILFYLPYLSKCTYFLEFSFFHY